MKEDKKLCIYAKRLLTLVLAIAIVFAPSLIPLGGEVPEGYLAYAETPGTTEAQIVLNKVSAEPTYDTVVLAAELKKVPEGGVSAIEFQINYPEEFELTNIENKGLVGEELVTGSRDYTMKPFYIAFGNMNQENGGVCKNSGKISLLTFKLKKASAPLPVGNYTFSLQEIKALKLVDDGEKISTQYVTVNQSSNWTCSVERIKGIIEINQFSGKEYDGNPVSYGVSAADITYSYTGDGDVEVKWYRDENGTKIKLNEAPSNPGSYWVGVSASAGAYYDAVAEVYLKFSIRAKDIDDSVKGAVSGSTVTYNGQPQPAVTVDETKTNGYTIEYATSASGEYKAEIPTVTNVSDSQNPIYVKISKENYKPCTTTVYAKVKPVEITEATVETEKTYTGKSLTFGVTEVKAGALALNSDAGDYEVSGNIQTNAGDDYKMIITGQGNYTGTIEKSFTIKKAQIDVNKLQWNTATAFDYNNATQKVQLVDVPDTLNITYSGHEARFVGTYKATAVAAAKDSENYEVTGEIEDKEWTINPIDQTPTITKAKSITKGGNTLDLKTLVSGAEGEVSFAIVNGDAATLDGTVLTTAADKTGEVVLNVSIAAKDVGGDPKPEYKEYSQENAITITVTEKEVKNLTVNQSGWTFGDVVKKPEYRAPSGLQKTTVTYSGTAKDGTKLENSEKAPTNAGDYTVTVSCETATEIYIGSKTFTIAQKSINGAEIELGTALTYTGAEQTQTVSSIKLKDTVLAADTDYTVSANTGTNAGTYTFSISGKNNYTGTLTKNFTIAKKEIAITGATINERVYAPGQKDVKVDSVAFGETTLTKGVDYRATGVMADDKAGDNKEVTVTVELWNENYKLTANEAKANVKIAKAVYETQNLNSTVEKGKSTVYDLSKYLKDGYEIVGVTSDSAEITVESEVKDGKLSYAVTDSAPSTGVITIKVQAANYADYEIKLTINAAQNPVPEVKVSDIEITYTGKALTKESIKGAATINGKTVAGTWSFDTEENLTEANDGTNVKVTFTPDDTSYAPVVTTIKVTINQARVEGSPKLPAVNAEGTTLGVLGKDAASGFGVKGTFTWDDENNTPVKKGVKYGWTFTPEDSNYAPLTGSSTPWASAAGGGGGGGFPIIVPVENPDQTAKDFVKDNLTVDGQVIKAASADNYAKILEAVEKYNKLTDAEKAAVDKELKAQGGIAFADLTAAAEKIKAEAASGEINAAKVKKVVLKAKSKITKLKGKKAIKVSWYIAGGELKAEDFDGFSIYRSVKKNKGYGKKAYYTTKKINYVNSKGLKKGKTYYYKVRAFKIIDGAKVYTPYSTKSWRKIK